MLVDPGRTWRYTWRRLRDTSDFPPGLADLIKEAYVLVESGTEWAGVFIHDEGRCWLGYKSALDTRTVAQSGARIFPSPTEAMEEAERLMAAGLLAPRRRARV